MYKKTLLSLVMGIFSIVLMSVNVQACGDMDCNKHEGIHYIEFGQNVHLFSAEPDYYIEDGIPVFHIPLPQEEWEGAFRYHPFFQNQTMYEDAIFVTQRYFEPLNNWCSNCGQRQQILHQRWGNVVTRSRTCPMFAMTGQSGMSTDMLQGWAWEFREFCNSCGWASSWSHGTAEQFMTWVIYCGNRGIGYWRIDVVVGGSLRRGHSPHQAVSFRNDRVIHGHNCQVECGINLC